MPQDDLEGVHTRIKVSKSQGAPCAVARIGDLKMDQVWNWVGFWFQFLIRGDFWNGDFEGVRKCQKSEVPKPL
jgi:hypothetical protein